MAYCPYCNDYFDEDNETQPCCVCGYSGTGEREDFISNSNQDDGEDEYYERDIQKLKLWINKGRNNRFEENFKKNIYYEYNFDISHFEESNENKSNEYHLYYHKSLYYIKNRDYENAVISILKAINILKNILKKVNNRNRFFNLKSVKSFFKEEKLLIKYYMHMGYIFQLANSFRDAIDSYKEILKLDINNFYAFLNIGYCYVNLNKIDLAIYYWDKCLKIDEDLFTVIEYYYYSYEKLKHFIKKLDYEVLFFDDRNSQEYRIARYGMLYWMIDNLDYEIDGSIKIINNTIKKKKYGNFYTYEQAIKACPNGWRIPTKNEVEILIHDLSKENYNVITNSSDNSETIYLIEGKDILENDSCGFEAILLGTSIEYENETANFWIQDVNKNNCPKYLCVNDIDPKHNLISNRESNFNNKYSNLPDITNGTHIVKLEFKNSINNVGCNLRCVKDLEYKSKYTEDDF